MLDKNFDAKAVEEKKYKNWEKNGCFAAKVDSNNKPYTIPMPPPNVTGRLHIGHALNHTIQDILSRFERMRGRDVLWQPGTDHAGIATQMIVERQLEEKGLKRQEMGREKFLEKVWEWKEESGGVITDQLRRLGASPDWERERFTMDDGMSKAVVKAFTQLYKEGLIYKDNRLVNWDPKMHTAVSDLEVEQIEVNGHFWHFKYPLEEDSSKFITIATTRPETLLGDMAIAVNKDDVRYKDLIGKNVILPLVGRVIPIIADEYADPEQGSGAVKITPAHDFNDFEVGKRHDLEMLNIFDKNAHINENAPEKYQGMERFAARKLIVKEMEALGLVDKIEDHVHTVPHDEKTKSIVIEPYLTEQWYCNAEVLAKPAIEAVEQGKVEFIPKNWEKTYFEWMRNIQPWCISRQLWWGHQIPAWYGEDGEIFVEESEEQALSAAEKHYGRKVELTRESDVLDTWFSSALWPFSTLGWPDNTAELQKYYPADTLVTAFDIIFFWVARMMMFGIHFMGEVPFKKIYMHALVRDENGLKMSKTKGNVIDPIELVEKFGADSVRFTLAAMAAQGRDIRLSETRVEGYRNFTTKLWNATKYCQMNECIPNPEFNPANVKHEINKWIISELADAGVKVEAALDDYKFNDAANGLYSFSWKIFCDWYLEFTKPMLSGDDKELIIETKETTAWVLNQFVTLLHPIMPYLTEELYYAINDIAEDSNEFLQDHAWPKFDASLIDQKSILEVNWAINVITEIRSVRADKRVPAKSFIDMLVKGISEDHKQALNKHEGIIKRLARIENVELIDGDAPQGSAQIVIDEMTIMLPISDVIDLDAEKARLQKEIDKLSIDVDRINKKLSNQGFLAKAPEQVVAEQKTKKQEAELVISKLNEALSQIAS